MDTSFQGYFVYRDDSDPTSLHFFPPRDTDDLFDALRAKFPQVKSHSERMRDAIIEFLMEERQADLIASTTSTSPILASDAASASPWQQSWPSVSTASSSFNSPDTLDIPTPAYLASPKPRFSNTLSQPTPPSASLSADQSPPQLEQMTAVFSLTSTAQPKQRIRRKMTEAEKVEYRRRRIVKACDNCQKRKRKCHHNQPEMETVSTKPNGKVSKTRSTPASTRVVKTEHVEHPPGQDNQLDLDAPLGSDMQLFDDFTNILDDDLFQMPVNAPPNADFYVHLNNEHPSLQSTDTDWFDHMWQYRDQLQQAATTPSGQQSTSQASAFGELPCELPVPTHTGYTHDTESELAYVYDATAGLGMGMSPPGAPSWPVNIRGHAPGQSALSAGQDALRAANRLLTIPRSSIRLHPASVGHTPPELPAQPTTLRNTALSREEWAMARDTCSYRSSAGGASSDMLDNAWNGRHLVSQSRSPAEYVDQHGSQPSGDRKATTFDTAENRDDAHLTVMKTNKEAGILKVSKSDSKIPFGSGIDRAKSPSAELFILRRRGLPPQVGRGVSSHVLATARAQIITAPAAALGSVLQAIPTSARPRQDGETAQRNPVAHTRGRNPSAPVSASPGDTDQRLVFTSGALPSLSEERLIRHDRYHDHHGRASSPATLLQAISSVMATLLVATILPQATWSAFLTMCVPISGGVVQKRKSLESRKKSSWLCSLPRLVPCC